MSGGFPSVSIIRLGLNTVAGEAMLAEPASTRWPFREGASTDARAASKESYLGGDLAYPSSRIFVMSIVSE